MLESSNEFLRQVAEKAPTSNILNEMLRMTDESNKQSEKWYTAKEAYKFLDTSEGNFRNWKIRFNKEHPSEKIEYTKKGKNTMYSLKDLERLRDYAKPHRLKNAKDDEAGISLIEELQPQQQQSEKAPTTVEAKDLIIDDEFKNLIQPLTESEFKQLEDDVLQNGIINPVIVIRDEASNNFTIIDGHHRHQIAAKHNLPIPLKEMKFNSRDDVEFWIVKNQFARRNLSTFSKALLVLKMKPVISKRAKENQLAALKQNTVDRSVNIDKTEQIDTRAIMATMAGISTGQMAKIELIANEANDELKQSIIEGNLSISKAYEELKAAKAPPVETPEPAQVESDKTFSDDFLKNTAYGRMIAESKSPERKTIAVNVQSTPTEPQKVKVVINQPESPTNQNELEAENAALKDEIAELKRKAYNTQGTGNNERYTPPEIIELVKEVLGTIDLDPASCSIANETVKAAAFYSSDDDGLSKEWTGKIFLNPPYSKDLIEKFVDKLINSQFDEAITLTHNCTETSWGGKLLKNSTAVSFPTGRIDCKTPAGDGGSPKQGSMICYFGSNPKKFIDVFSRIGNCLKNERRIN